MADIATLSIPIEVDIKTFEAYLKRIDAQAAKIKPISPDVETASLSKAERDMIALSKASAALARDQGNLAESERILLSARDRSTAGTTQAIGIERQLLKVRNEIAAKSNPKGGGFFAGVSNELQGIASFANPAALAVGGVTAAFALAGSAMLETAERAKVIKQTLGELSAADLQQVDEAAVLLSSRFGADLTKQVAAARVVMQAFGTDGAEAMDVIAAGFENGLNSADDLTDTLQEYSTFFSALGFSADETLTIIQQGLANGARNTDYIGDAIKELGIRLGEVGTAGKLAPLSAELAGLVEQFQAGTIGGPEAFTAIVDAIAEIEDPVAQQAAGVALFGTKFEDLGIQAVTAMGQVDQALINSANAAEQAGARIESVGEVFPRLFAGLGQALQPVNTGIVMAANNVLQLGANMDQANFEGLTGSARAYAESQRAAGASISEAFAATQAFLPTLNAIGAAQEQVTASWDGSAESAAALAQRLTDVASTSAGNEMTVRALATAYDQGRISLQDLEASLAAIETAHTAAADAATEQAGAIGEVAAVMDLTVNAAAAQAAALRDAADAAFEQANAGGTLEEQARAAADALIAAGNAGAQAADVLGNSTAPLDRLTAAYYRLATAQGAAGQSKGIGGALGNLGGANGLIKGAGEATATIRALNRVYGAGPLGGKPPRSGGGGGGGGTSAVDKERAAAEKLNETLASIQTRYSDAALNAETSYQDRRKSIIEDANAAILKGQQDLAVASAASRADFYDSLTQADIPPDVAKGLSAAYEEAFAEAQRLSAEGKAALAADFLDLKQQQISAEAQYQAKLKAAQDKGDKGEVARLQAIQKLREQANTVQLDALLQGGDKTLQTRDTALADADTQRQDALAKAAATAGDALGEAQQKGIDQATLHNAALTQQLALLTQIGQKTGTTPTAPTTTTGSAPAAAAPATPEAPASAPSLSDGSGGPVAVVDAAVARAIADLARSMRARGNTQPGG